MVDGAGRLSRFLPPILLVVLTVSVFSRLQDYGPESTLRRFHEAAIAGDVAMLDATTLQGANSPAVQDLALGIRTFAQRGAPMRPLAMSRTPGRAQCEVVYADPESGMLVHIFWFLVLKGGTWKIDADRTEGGWYRSTGQIAPPWADGFGSASG